jgi:Uma2 family endonuclease
MVKAGVTLMTQEEFMQRYGEQGPFEVIEGEIVEMTPQVTRSARIGGRLFLELAVYLKSRRLGEAFIETPFVLTTASNSVKGSRVPDWQDKPLTIVPDLVVEIVSPTDRIPEVDKKIARYLADGVQIVWVIEPKGQTVKIYTYGSRQITLLKAEDMLSGGNVIPGFEMPVVKLFGAENEL